MDHDTFRPPLQHAADPAARIAALEAENAALRRRVDDLATAYDLLRVHIPATTLTSYAGLVGYRGHHSPINLARADKLRRDQ